MLLPRHAYIWSSAPLPPSAPASFVPMVYASPNKDNSYSGYDSTTAAAQINARGPGKRVLIFQGMLSGLFSVTPPFYNPSACLPHVATFFQALRAAGITQLDAVIPDVEGALCDWQITPAVATEILASPFASDFLSRIGYTGDKTGLALSFFVQTHRETVEPVLGFYADMAILAATKPMRDLYGDVLIQKGSLDTPAWAASAAPWPCDAGDTPGIVYRSSFAQCDELYGAVQAGYPLDVWTAQKVAQTTLLRVASAAASSPKPVVPWIAPKSYTSPASIPWANTPVYDAMLKDLAKMTRGTLLYWRPDTATAADDEAVAAAIG